MKTTMRHHELCAWFVAFTQSPLAYHSLSCSVYVHRQLVGADDHAKDLEMSLFHKGKTISLVNNALDDMQKANMDDVLHAIIVLWRVNPVLRQETCEDTSLFVPHLPYANWVNVWSRTERVPMHAAAFYWLVEKLGGIDKLKLPGLKHSFSM